MLFLFDKKFLTNTIIVMKVSISELENLKDKSLDINFKEVIKELNPETPVTAILKAALIGNEYINVSGKISACLSLTCDNCLKNFIKNIEIEINETFIKTSLFSESNDEIELKEGSFIEDLNGADEIDITDLIYQSVTLNLPNKLVCDINCIGDENYNKYVKKDISDPRLDIFKSIKTEKDK